MAKIIGSALPNIPWQEPPANTRTPFWRYDANPIIGRDGNARSPVHNHTFRQLPAR